MNMQLPEIDFQELATGILALLDSGKSKDFLLSDIVILVQQATGIDSIGLRIQEGFDFPYYVTRGFPRNFVEKEMFLCTRDQRGEISRDPQGRPQLACMCGNVIRGRTDPALPFFTRGGSFWTNSTSALLANSSQENLQSATRNRCQSEGYESVALIPVIDAMTTHGLLQLNDRRANLFNEDFIEQMEWVAASIGVLFSVAPLNENLSQLADDLRKYHPSRVLGSLKERT